MGKPDGEHVQSLLLLQLRASPQPQKGHQTEKTGEAAALKTSSVGTTGSGPRHPVCLDCHHAVTPDKCLLKADTYKVKRTQRIRLQPTHPWVSGFCRECASRIQDTMHAHREGKWVRAGSSGRADAATAFIFSSLPRGLGRSGPPKAASERAGSRKPDRTGAPQVPWSSVCRATQAMGSHHDPAHTYYVIPQSTGPQTHRAQPGLPRGHGGHRWGAWLVSGLQSFDS